MAGRTGLAAIILAWGLFLVALATGCSPVAANYPRTDPKVRANPFVESQLTCALPGLRFWVGDRIDTAAARARQATVYGPMREAMGESAFREVQAEAQATHPWTTRITGDDSCDYYRGSFVLDADIDFVLAQGAFVFGEGPADASSVRDLGVLIRLGENERAWRFSGDGPVDSRMISAGPRPGQVVLVTFRLPRNAAIATVRLDSTRIRIVAPGEGPAGT